MATSSDVLCEGWLGRLGLAPRATAAACRRDCTAQRARRGEDTVVTRQVDVPRRRDTEYSAVRARRPEAVSASRSSALASRLTWRTSCSSPLLARKQSLSRKLKQIPTLWTSAGLALETTGSSALHARGEAPIEWSCRSFQKPAYFLGSVESDITR
jgi:hypothetical protein